MDAFFKPKKDEEEDLFGNRPTKKAKTSHTPLVSDSDSDIDFDLLPEVEERIPEVVNVTNEMQHQKLKEITVFDLTSSEDNDDQNKSSNKKTSSKLKNEKEEEEEEEYDDNKERTKTARHLLNLHYLLWPIEEHIKKLRAQLNIFSIQEAAGYKTKGKNSKGKQRIEIVSMAVHPGNHQDSSNSKSNSKSNSTTSTSSTSTSSSSSSSSSHQTMDIPDDLIDPNPTCLLGRLPLFLIAYCLNGNLRPWEFTALRVTKRYYYYHLGEYSRVYWKELFMNQKKAYQNNPKKDLSLYADAIIVGDDYKTFFKSIIQTITIQTKEEHRLVEPPTSQFISRARPNQGKDTKKKTVASMTASHRGNRTGAPPTSEEAAINVDIDAPDYEEPDQTELIVTNIASMVTCGARISLRPGFNWSQEMIDLELEVMRPLGLGLHPHPLGSKHPWHTNAPIDPTLIKEEQLMENETAPRVMIRIAQASKQKARIDIGKYASIASQYNAAQKSLHALNKYVKEREMLKNIMRRTWPGTKTEFTEIGENGGPIGTVNISTGRSGILQTRQIFNEKVWAQLDDPAKRRLLQAKVVYREEAKRSGPTSRVSRRGKSDFKNTMSIQAVRSGANLPLVTRYYEDL
jgi:hypothetical protein